MRQNIFVLGATGNVGKEFLQQYIENDAPHIGKHENPTVVVGLADSNNILINAGGFPPEFLRHFVDTRLKVRQVLGAEKYSPENVTEITDRMKKIGFGEDLIYGDLTGAKEPARKLHQHIIQNTRSKIVTANKNPIGLYSNEEYETLTGDPQRYKYSATAMAGLGAVPWLSERHTIQDNIHQFNASLSGTVGFITDALANGCRLSEAIQSARTTGYTEPDYRDDLNGVDVARKLTILGREAGFPIEYHDIHIEPFLPQEYLEMADAEECLKKIKEEFDGVIAARYSDAKERGMTLKYLASLENHHDKPSLTVKLQEVPQASAFGKLEGTNNRIEVVTDMYSKERPYKLEGPGAGLDITASVVRRDLVNLQPRVNRFEPQ